MIPLAAFGWAGVIVLLLLINRNVSNYRANMNFYRQQIQVAKEHIIKLENQIKEMEKSYGNRKS